MGRFLRATRERLELTQAQVAERTRESPWQLSRAAISAIERGQNFPGLEAMLALSNVLSIDPKELIERARLTAVVPVDVTGISDEDLERRASQYFWAGDYKRALGVYDALVEKLALSGSGDAGELKRRLATLEIRRATALKRAGALISAIASAERAIVLAAGVPAVQAEAYVALADLQVQRGHLPLAEDAAERAIQLATQASATRPLAWAWMVKGRVLYQAQRFARARRAFEHARERLAAADDRRHRTHVEGDIGMCLLALGRVDDARRAIGVAVELARAGGQHGLQASWLVELGKIELARGRLDEAERLARRALRLARPREHDLTVFRAEWLRYRAARSRGRRDAGRQRLRLLRHLFSRLDEHEGIDEINEFRRTVLSEIGDGEESDG